MVRPVDSEMLQIIEADCDCTVHLTKCHVDIDTDARDHCQFNGACGTCSKHFHVLGRDGQLASQEFAFGPVQFQLENEVMAALPTLICQECLTGDEILQGRGIGGRPLGPSASDKVELSHLEALIFRSDET